jgi:hypothetical protein
MNEDEKKMFDTLVAQTAENHRILRELERQMRLNYLWTGLKVAIVFLPLILGYLYLQPFLDKINRIYGVVGSNSTSTFSETPFGRMILKALTP